LPIAVAAGEKIDEGERAAQQQRKRSHTSHLLSCASVDSQLLAYLTFTAVLVLTPGSTTAVVVRNALAGGRHAGIAAAMGAALGNSTHAVAAGLGLAVLFARIPWALASVSVAGAAFLGWLGARSLYHAIASRDRGLAIGGPEVRAASRFHRGSFRQGIGVNLLNPVIATFYLVVVPSFVPPGAPRWYFAALAAIHIGMALVCHAAWALALEPLRGLFRRPLASTLLEGATGVALLVLAVRVLAQL
jgi:threonine/homoserine/homoserine lactone efflux protein